MKDLQFRFLNKITILISILKIKFHINWTENLVTGLGLQKTIILIPDLELVSKVRLDFGLDFINWNWNPQFYPSKPGTCIALV